MNILLSNNNNENDLHVTRIIQFYDFHSITLSHVNWVFHMARQVMILKIQFVAVGGLSEFKLCSTSWKIV